MLMLMLVAMLMVTAMVQVLVQVQVLVLMVTAMVPGPCCRCLSRAAGACPVLPLVLVLMLAAGTSRSH